MFMWVNFEILILKCGVRIAMNLILVGWYSTTIYTSWTHDAFRNKKNVQIIIFRAKKHFSCSCYGIFTSYNMKMTVYMKATYNTSHYRFAHTEHKIIIITTTQIFFFRLLILVSWWWSPKTYKTKKKLIWFSICVLRFKKKFIKIRTKISKKLKV